MIDPVMAMVARAGALTLRELFSRAGKDNVTTMRIAKLLKDGDLRIETVEGRETAIRNAIEAFTDVQRLPESEISARLLDPGEIFMEDLQVIPTSRGWRKVTA